MKSVVLSFALLAILALSGCDSNPTGPSGEKGAAPTAVDQSQAPAKPSTSKNAGKSKNLEPAKAV